MINMTDTTLQIFDIPFQAALQVTIDPEGPSALNFAEDRLTGLVEGAHGDHGFPDLREVRDRLKTAVIDQGFNWPTGTITVTILGPAGFAVIRGAHTDLPIAAGILIASGQAQDRRVPGGVIGLDGSIRTGRWEGYTLRGAVTVDPVRLNQAGEGRAKPWTWAELMQDVSLDGATPEEIGRSASEDLEAFEQALDVADTPEEADRLQGLVNRAETLYQHGITAAWVEASLDDTIRVYTRNDAGARLVQTANLWALYVEGRERQFIGEKDSIEAACSHADALIANPRFQEPAHLGYANGSGGLDL